MPDIGVAIPTLNARNHLPHCLPPVFASPLRPRVLVVDSSSGDGTAEVARDLGAEVVVIPRTSFNHGATRELARQRLGTTIVVMMTQDAYPVDAGFLERLVRPLCDGSASVAYGRQIPRDGADVYEAFRRDFYYPPEGHVRGMDDLARFGVLTFFCSNCCAAWRNQALDEVGGFFPVLTAEDTFVAARLLARGHRIAYVADAVVRHSHRYSITDEFKLLFDTGCVRARYRDLFEGLRDEGIGSRYARGLLGRVARERAARLPAAVLRVGAMYAGYRLGRLARWLPRSFCRRLSSQDYYWDSDYAGL